MDGDRAPVAALAALAREHDALLAIDEAHAAGILDDETPVDLRIGTLGKALGGFGAYVAASTPLVDLLRAARPQLRLHHGASRSRRRRGARRHRLARRPTKAAPAVAALADNARYFHERRGLAGTPSHIVPLHVRDGDPRRAMAACEALLERGIFAQGIRPPTVPPGTARASASR